MPLNKSRSKSAGNSIDKMGKDIGSSVGKVGKNIGARVGKVGKNIGARVGNIGKNVGKLSKPKKREVAVTSSGRFVPGQGST
jgi:hypothetical protein